MGVKDTVIHRVTWFGWLYCNPIKVPKKQRQNKQTIRGYSGVRVPFLSRTLTTQVQLLTN